MYIQKKKRRLYHQDNGIALWALKYSCIVKLGDPNNNLLDISESGSGLQMCYAGTNGTVCLVERERWIGLLLIDQKYM